MKRLSGAFAGAALLVAAACPAFAQDSKPKPEVEARALCDQAKGKHGKAAIELYDQAIKLDPSCIDAFIGRGGERRYTEPALALADFARADAIKDDFQPAASWYRIVVLLDVYLDRSAAWDEAERLKRRALKGAWSYVGAGTQELLAGHPDKAEEYFDKAGQNDSSIPLTWRFKAMAQYDYGNALARDTAAQAVKANTDDPGTAATMALVSNADDHASAARELDRILSETPKLAWARLAKAMVCVKNSKWEEALAACTAADAAAPGGPATSYLRSFALEGTGKLAEAESALNNAVNWDSNFPEALLRRGDLRLKLHDWSGALRDFEAWQRFAIDPQLQKMLTDKTTLAKNGKEREEGVIVSFNGYCQRARVFIEEGDFDRAEKDIETARTLEEKNERWRRLRIYLYAAKKDFPRMWELVQKMMDDGVEAIVTFFDPRVDGAKIFLALRKEAGFIEGLRKVTIKAARDQYLKAQVLYEAGMAIIEAKQSGFEPLLRESAAEYRKLCDTWKESPEVSGSYYNEACCWSLVGDLDKAFEALDKAIDTGYGKDGNAIVHMEKNDTDLAKMRKDSRWEAIVKKVKEKWAPK
ncbi:MAG: tetratricopeptide repeat protein [Planctomycetota bacterium]